MQRERTSTHRRRWLVLASVVFLILLAAFASYWIWWQHRRQALQIQTANVQLATMQRTIFSSGDVRPVERQLVYTNSLPGPVEKLNVGVGSVVKKGTTLLTVNIPNQQAAITSAESALAQANQDYARALKGYQNAPSVLQQLWLPQLSAAESEVSTAKAQLQTAKAQQTQDTIKANFGGIVLIANKDGIDSSGNQAPVLELVGDDKQVVLDLSEVDATHVQKGMKVTMTTDAYPNQTFHGKVSLVAPYAQITQSGSGQVEVDIDPTGTFSVPFGYQVDCKIASATHKQVPTVPYSALVQQGTNYAVFVVSGNIVHLRTVQLGITDNNRVEVTSGVKAGDKVVLNPPSQLQNGQEVSTG